MRGDCIVFAFHECILPISYFLVFIENQGIYVIKLMPSELASIFMCFTDEIKFVYMPLSIHCHDLHYRAVLFAVQISNQNTYVHGLSLLKSAPKNCLRYCILKVEIGTDVNHNVL